MYVVISVLIIIICLLLGLIVLIQNPKGGGLDSSFGSANQLGGVKKTTDFLEKATWTLAIAIMVLSIVSSSFQGSTPIGVSNNSEEFLDQAPQQQQAPTAAPAEEAAPAPAQQLPAEESAE